MALEIYDRNLSSSHDSEPESESEPEALHMSRHHDHHDHQRREGSYAPASCQQYTVDLLHALSSSKTAIQRLFDEQRFDIVFGYLGAGGETARALVTAEMWRLLQHLPGSSGAGVRREATGRASVNGASVNRVSGDEAGARTRARAQHLAQLMVNKPSLLALLLDTLSAPSTTSSTSSASASVPTSPESRQRQKQQQEALCILCELVDYDDGFMAALLIDNDRHHALCSLVEHACVPMPPSDHCSSAMQSFSGDERSDREALFPSTSSSTEDIDSWEDSAERYHPPEPPPFHAMWASGALQESHCQPPLEGDGAEEDWEARDWPSARVSALYTLHRLAAYARNDKDPALTFDLLWRAGAVPVLLRAFLNHKGDGGLDLDLDMQGRKYAALALAQLCEHPSSRRLLVLMSQSQSQSQAQLKSEARADADADVVAAGVGGGIGGIKLLEMIEWFLQEEVYQRV